MSGYDELGNAIIIQAREDLCKAYIDKQEAETKLEAARRMIDDVMTFLNGKHYRGLTDLNAEIIVRTARTKADYHFFRKKRHCGVCKRRCPYTKADAWPVWEKDKVRTCIVIAERERKRKENESCKN